MTKPDVKPFAIPKLLVWEAWRQVKANKGAPGVDGQDLDSFEADLRDNLYKIWNRMSSGTYFPPPVRAVEIPKPHAEVGLTVHPEKTRIVYCKDGKRRGDHEHISLTFLGYTFRARKAINSKTGETFTRFLPAIFDQALKAKSARLREMRIGQRTDLTLDQLAEWLNPIIAGWIKYYGRFYLRNGEPLTARQLLLEALGDGEVQAVADVQAVQAMVGRVAPTSTRPVHPLADRPHVLTGW